MAAVGAKAVLQIQIVGLWYLTLWCYRMLVDWCALLCKEQLRVMVVTDGTIHSLFLSGQAVLAIQVVASLGLYRARLLVWLGYLTGAENAWELIQILAG